MKLKESVDLKVLEELGYYELKFNKNTYLKDVFPPFKYDIVYSVLIGKYDRQIRVLEHHGSYKATEVSDIDVIVNCIKDLIEKGLVE